MSNKEMKKVFIVDNSVYTIEKLEQVFYTYKNEFQLELIGSARTFSETVEKKANIATKADVFLIAMVLPDKNGYELIHYIKRNINPKAKFIAMATENTKSLLDKAMKAGSDAHLIKSFSAKEAVQKIYDVLGMNFYQAMELVENQGGRKTSIKKEVLRKTKPKKESKIRKRKEEKVIVEDEVEEIIEPKVENVEDVVEEIEEDLKYEDIYKPNYEYYDDEPSYRYRKKPQTKVFTFLSAKSSGRTTALVNVAAEISKNSEFKPKTIILDFDLLYPTVFYKFKEEELIKAKKNIYDLIEDIEILDEQIILDACHIHEKTNLHILNTPYKMLKDPDALSQNDIKLLIEEIKKYFDVILIDAAGSVDDATTMVPILLSDKNLIFFNSEITSLLHTRKLVDILKRMEEKAEVEILNNSYFILNELNEEEDYITFEQIKEAVSNFDENIEFNLPLYIPKDDKLNYYSVIGQLAVLVEETIPKKKGKNISAKEKYKELAALLYPMFSQKGNKEANKKEFRIFGFKISK